VISDGDMASINAFRPQGNSRHPTPSHFYRQSISCNDVSKKIDQIVHSGEVSTAGESGDPFSKKIEKGSTESYERGLEEQ
tara:strand:- start:343 stop:582 length:240 start_codon:yes stop_codon:yes gene_type:complete